LTIGGGWDSQNKPINTTGEAEYIKADGHFFYVNYDLKFGNMEYGFAKEEYETSLGYSYTINNDVDIKYVGLNFPLQLPIGIKIVPGVRYGSYKNNVSVDSIGDNSAYSENDESAMFAAFATRIEINIVGRLGVYAEGNVKRIFSDNSYELLKIHGGIKVSFSK